MKTRKIQARLKDLLSADRRAQVKQADAIKELLAKLKKKERHLRDKLSNCKDDEDSKKLKVKIAVCHAQREKGLTILKEIKNQSEAPGKLKTSAGRAGPSEELSSKA